MPSYSNMRRSLIASAPSDRDFLKYMCASDDHEMMSRVGEDAGLMSSISEVCCLRASWWCIE